MSNLLHVAEHSSSRFDYVDYIYNLPIFNSLKVSLQTFVNINVFFIINISDYSFGLF
jgi:hypothetical protein